MGAFAVVVMLPESLDPDPFVVDFNSREFETWEEFAAMMKEYDSRIPNWRLVTVCHVEDLPVLMEGPDADADSP